MVDMVINNLGGGQHPMHLHGHWMWIMARGQPKDGLFDPVKTPLSKTPVLRDTVTINLKSYAVLRFVADNPGAWIFHCECQEGSALAGPGAAQRRMHTGAAQRCMHVLLRRAGGGGAGGG